MSGFSSCSLYFCLCLFLSLYHLFNVLSVLVFLFLLCKVQIECVLGGVLCDCHALAFHVRGMDLGVLFGKCATVRVLKAE